MFDKIRSMFTPSDETDGDDKVDPKTAAATLMVEIALADGVYADIEERRIRKALTQTFELDEAESSRILAEAESLAEAAVDHHRFTRAVKSLPKETRLALMEQKFLIAFADGENDAHEDSLLRRLGPLLAISDRERAEARARARDRADHG